MGLPIERLVVATNANDLLSRTLHDGRYEPRGVVPTQSPSMDIQDSSNFERLLFEATGRDGSAVTAMMQSLAQSGAFTIPQRMLLDIRSLFEANAADERATRVTIERTWKGSRYLADPHTAVGLAVGSLAGVRGPMVHLATAHPAKFPDAVRAATGIEPQLPVWLADLDRREERYDVLPNDQRAVEDYIRSRARVAEDVQ
jgi:threonine synthase